MKEYPQNLIPFLLYGTRFDKRMLKDIKQLDFFPKDKLDVLFETKGRYPDGTVISYYIEYVNALNYIIDNTPEKIRTIVEKYQNKINKYSEKHFDEINSSIDAGLEFKYYYLKIANSSDKSQKNIDNILKGASKDTIKKIKEIIPDSIEYPSEMDMIKSFSASMSKWAKSGFKFAEKELIQKRLEICKSCEFWDSTSIISGGRCKKCGCATRAKISMATEKCPENKW